MSPVHSLVAAATVLGAGLAHFLLTPWVGRDVPLTIYVLAVAASSYFGGVGPGLLATLLSVITAHGLTGRSGELGPPTTGAGYAIRMVLFGLVGMIVSVLSELRQRAASRAEAAATMAGLKSEALLVSENRFEQMVETANEGIWQIDAEARTVYANRHMADLLGYTPEEMSGLDAFALVPEQARETSRAIWAVEARTKTRKQDFVYRRKDGREIWLHCSSSPILDSGGQFRGALGMFTDVTERRASEQEREALLRREQAARREAEAASRMKDEFLATLSHELRTPLNAVVGWSHLLRTGQLTGDKVQRAVEVIDRNARAQSQVVADLLDVSSIAMGKLRLEVRTLQLAPLIQAALDSVAPAARAKQIRIAADLDSVAGAVSGDPGRLQQVLWNLLHNAVKFTPAGGEVRVGLSAEDDGVEIVVQDTGEGITADFLPHVFERFRQRDASPTRTHGGLGIGLALVRDLVEIHGGTVSASSPGENQGTRFVVRLPRVMQPEAGAAGAARTAG